MATKRQRGLRGRHCIYSRKSRTLGTRWVVSISYRDWNGDRRRPQLTFATREAAIAGAAFLEQTKAAKGRVGEAVLTLQQLALQWFGQLEVESGSKNYYRVGLETHILPYLGRTRVIELQPQVIDQWKNLLADTGVGPAARRGAWSVLKGLLRYAVKLRVLTMHPMSGLDVPRKQAKPIVPFTEAEMAAIFAGCREHRLRPLLQLNYSLALRQGEVFGLRWEDYDTVAGTLAIHRQVVDEGHGPLVKEQLKTKSGRRVLILADEHRAILETRRLQAEDEGLVDCPWIFPTRKGQPIGRGNFTRQFWKPLLARLKIRHRGLHHFRHTAITQMLLDGANLLDVSGTAGHSLPGTTLALYGHVVEKIHGQPLGSLAKRALGTIELNTGELT